MFRQGTAMVALFGMAIAQTACDEETSTCVDCGPCGDDSPNVADGQSLTLVGTVGAQPALAFSVSRKGVCGDELEALHVFVWTGAALEPRPQLGESAIDTSTVSWMSGTYTWAGLPVTLRSSSLEGNVEELTIVDGGVTFTQQCTLQPDYAVTCAPAP